MRNFVLLATAFFCFISSGAEKLVFDYKKSFSKLPENFQSKSVFSTQSPAFLLDNSVENKRNVVSRSFYVFYRKHVPLFLGKTLIAKMKVRRLKGKDPLTLSFRILGIRKPVGGSRLEFDFPADGRWHDVEISCTIPAKENVVSVLMELKKRGASLNILTASPHITLDACLKDWAFLICSTMYGLVMTSIQQKQILQSMLWRLSDLIKMSKRFCSWTIILTLIRPQKRPA